MPIKKLPFIKSLQKSFAAAGRGFFRALHTERTFQVMTAIACLVLILVFTLPLSSSEQLILLLATGLIMVLELVNTMVERLVDLLKPRLNIYVRDVKDLMAAAVFVASLFAFIIGLVIVVPHFRLLFHQL